MAAIRFHLSVGALPFSDQPRTWYRSTTTPLANRRSPSNCKLRRTPSGKNRLRAPAELALLVLCVAVERHQHGVDQLWLAFVCHIRVI